MTTTAIAGISSKGLDAAIANTRPNTLVAKALNLEKQAHANAVAADWCGAWHGYLAAANCYDEAGIPDAAQVVRHCADQYRVHHDAAISGGWPGCRCPE